MDKNISEGKVFPDLRCQVRHYFTAKCLKARMITLKGPIMSNEKNKFPSSFVSSQFVKYVDSKEIKGILEALGNQISQKYQGQDLVLIGVLKGSMVFMADLIREIKGVKV